MAKKTYKDLREQMGLKQYELATILGLTDSHYCLIEHYKRKLSISKAIEFDRLYKKKTGKDINFLADVRHA